MKGVRIRKATRDDREAIERLVELGANDVRKRIGPHPPPVRMDDLGARGCMGLVAVNGDKVIGSVAYRVRGGRLHLFNLVVDAEHRKNGVAKRLVGELENVAQKEGAKHITLQTVAELGIQPLFVGLGFCVQSAKREFLFTPTHERAMTTVYMVKRLAKSPRNLDGR